MAGRWLYPGPRDGLLIEEARGWRFECRDGALVEHRPEEEPRALAAAGDVTGLTIVTGERMPKAMLLLGRRGPTEHDQALVVHTDAGPVVAVPVLRLAHQSTSDAAAGRAAAGLSRFAQCFGHPLERDESASPPEVTSYSAGPVLPRLLRTSRVHLALVGVFLLLLAVYGALVERDGALADTHPVPLVAMCVVLFVLTVDLVRQRRTFARLVTRPPAPDGRRVVDGGGPWELQVGRDDVVLHGSVHEQWVPGPARGGVDRCTIDDDVVVFARGDDPALFVPRTMVAEDDLRDACRDVDIAVERRRGPNLDSGTAGRLAAERSGSVLGAALPSLATASGSLITPAFTTIAGLLLLGITLDPERRGTPAMVAIGAGAAVVVVVQATLWWLRRRWVAQVEEAARRA